jgi:parallel beta-helix repeat protein
MKNFFKNRPVSAFVFSEKLSVLFFLFTATIFAVSCQKDITEKINTPITADSETASQVAAAVAAANNTYYLSPSGNDNNAGTISSPFFSLNKAWAVIVPGDLVYLRGGTYAFKTQQYLTGKSGTAGNLIKIWAYPNEIPVLTKGAGYTNNYFRGGCYFSGDYFHFKGLDISGFAQQDAYVWNGLLVDNSNNNIFEQLNVHDNGGGMYIQNSSTGNLVLNSDFHHNYDPITNGGNSDGLDVAYVAAGTSNTVRGCRAWQNSDDGFDAFENHGYVLYDNCWSWSNGYVPYSKTVAGNGEGFKLGRAGTGNSAIILRKVINCLSFENNNSGFHQEEADCRMELYNNVAYNNVEHGFLFDYLNRAHIAKNNIAYKNGNNQAVFSPTSTVSNNSYGTGYASSGWVQTTSDADFLSVNSAGVDGARQADGSLPALSFLHLAAAVSDLKDAGVNVGIPYNGTAPDLGAFETGGTTPPPANQIPVANAGADQLITLPVNSLSLSGSGTDPDGSIQSYSWTKQSGGAATLAGATTATLNVSGLIAGTYVFRLTVTDDKGATGFDEVTLLVNSNTILPPPSPSTNIINVSGAVQDAGFSYYVAQDFGTSADISSNPTRSVLRIFENGIELLPPHSSHSDIQNIGRGRFSHWSDGSFVALYFSASDNSNPKTNGRTYTYSITTTAVAANIAPLANAGIDKTITLPVNNISITGSGSDPDGTIASYTWSLQSGPNTPSLSGSGTATLSAGNLIAGTYVFRLTVTDNGGLKSFDEVNIVVNSATVTSPSTNVIKVSRAVKDAGFSYYVAQNFGTPADISSNPTRSVLRIFENGVELLPPHSSHSDIQNIGKGRFSHWNDGSFVALYFSASDNSNPKTNGRTYTYSITPK